MIVVVSKDVAHYLYHGSQRGATQYETLVGYTGLVGL
jgi:hypothetical protein